jgi:transposase
MDVLYPRCAGLDVHKETVVACVRVAAGRAGAAAETTVRRFATTTAALEELATWLAEHGCTHVVMEATGVYWKPVWHILAEGERFTLILANAAHVKAVPGRKSDVTDAAWLADLLAHGLIRGSFVPDAQIATARTLLRTRKQLVREQVSHTQRLQKTLEDANIKLDSVVSEILGVSGRAMMEALIAGETDPAALAARAHRRLTATPEALCAALHGRVTATHRFLLRLHLDQVDQLARAIATVDQEVEALMAPFRPLIRLLITLPGLSVLSAQILLSEIGADMSRFPSAGHLLSWAGLCPRLDESAGQRRSTRLRPGAAWLKTVLVQCAWAATRRKGSYFHAQYHRLRARRGPKKAICAVAASLLAAAYHMLKTGAVYQDLGADHFDRRSSAQRAQPLVQRLEALGYTVSLTPAAEAA